MCGTYLYLDWTKLLKGGEGEMGRPSKKCEHLLDILWYEGIIFYNIKWYCVYDYDSR